MKQQINEFKRMQQLAGIITESEAKKISKKRLELAMNIRTSNNFYFKFSGYRSTNKVLILLYLSTGHLITTNNCFFFSLQQVKVYPYGKH